MHEIFEKVGVKVLLPTFLLILASCSGGSAPDSGADPSPSETGCEVVAVGSELCVAKVTEDYDAVRTSSGSQKIVIVDAGGPLTSRNAVVSILSDLRASSELDEYDLVALVPKEPAELTATCRESVESLDSSCDVDELSDLYLSGYAKAASQEVEAFDEVFVLGASYASARWFRLVDTGITPRIDRGVFVSPLNAGTDLDQLEQDALQVADRLFAFSVRTSCYEPSCLAGADLIEDCPECSLIARIANIAELTPEEVGVGLAGLAPLIETNAPQVGAAIENDDRDGLRSLISSGAASYRVLDIFGERHAANVHLLAGVCPLMRPSLGRVGPPWDSCRDIDSVKEDWDAIGFSLVTEVGDPTFGATCFLSNQPDPVLGLASTRGLVFGDSIRSETIFKSFGHGDLNLGVVALLSGSDSAPCGDAAVEKIGEVRIER